MLREANRTYTVLMDQLQDAYDEDLRLKEIGRINRQICHECVSVQDRIETLIEQISVLLEPASPRAS